MLIHVQFFDESVALCLQARNPRLQLQEVDAQQVLLLLQLFILLAECLDVIENANFLLLQYF